MSEELEKRKFCAFGFYVIGTPEYIVPLCVVYIGYPDEQPEPKQRESNVHQLVLHQLVNIAFFRHKLLSIRRLR